MKKLLILVLAAFLMVAAAACNAKTETSPTASSVKTAEATAQTSDAAAWKIKVGEKEFAEKDLVALGLVTQKINKQTKEGDIKEHECVGYTLKSILDLAEAAEYSKIVVVAADGAEYELDADVAALTTTMLTVQQDGEAYKTPRLAVEGQGSNAWLKDVVEIRIQK